MVGTFPLNVQAGSLQYTLASEITPTSSTTTITITIINTGQVTPVSNAYYTIQNEDGSKWCTFYVESWTQVGGWIPADAPITFTGSCTYSSSNTTDVFPEGSICWCIWCKEYYDSLIAKIGSSSNTVKVSQLEWDTNLVIPDGYLLSTPNITLAGHPLNVITRTVSGKKINIGDNTLTLVSSSDAVIHVDYSCVNNSSNTQSVSITFTATDVLGMSKNITTRNISVQGGYVQYNGFNVSVPAGTVKVSVTRTTNENMTFRSFSMDISDYTTSYVF